jgi:hypothetical protein
VNSFALLYRKTLGVASLALIPAGIGCALLSLIQSLLAAEKTDLVLAAGIFFLMVLFTYCVGLVLIFLVGAPTYAFLALHRQDKWTYVLALGVAPGLVLLFFDKNLGPLMIGCGAFVAAWTHHTLVQHRQDDQAAVV